MTQMGCYLCHLVMSKAMQEDYQAKPLILRANAGDWISNATICFLQ